MTLTEYEALLLREYVNGATPADIATRRGVGLSTVRNELAALKRRLGVTAVRDPANAMLGLLAAGLELEGPDLLEEGRLARAIGMWRWEG